MLGTTAADSGLEGGARSVGALQSHLEAFAGALDLADSIGNLGTVLYGARVKLQVLDPRVN